MPALRSPASANNSPGWRQTLKARASASAQIRSTPATGPSSQHGEFLSPLDARIGRTLGGIERPDSALFRPRTCPRGQPTGAPAMWAAAVFGLISGELVRSEILSLFPWSALSMVSRADGFRPAGPLDNRVDNRPGAACLSRQAGRSSVRNRQRPGANRGANGPGGFQPPAMRCANPLMLNTIEAQDAAHVVQQQNVAPDARSGPGGVLSRRSSPAT